ncbi:MAG: helicase C-terminal domain-containing protein [Dehalococcoidia bacterium]|nr:helicase C-terminal domain-containing protein [Dehalococcoidia bacterium]
MPVTYVALDLETTGLDPQSDAIIEIGAVKFTREGVVDQFATLVNPHRPIPERVQILTGIRQEDVQDAPPLEAVAADLETFIEGCPLVGSNVIGFDAPLLDARGVGRSPEIYDTHDLASLLLPGLAEYGLAGLARHFEIDMPVHHRAPADAETSRQVFLALAREATALPADVLSQVAEWLAPTAWPWRGFFREVWEEAAAAGRPSRPFALRRPDTAEPLQPRERPRPVDAEEALAVLASASGRPDVLPQFEERPQQQAALRAVTEALNQGQKLLLEAGTGTGKSLAYLIPAAAHATANGSRVVVSTATINLQEQLAGKDIPALKALLSADGELRSCLLKGRSNYLCLRRFEALRASPALTDDEARIAARILIWLTRTETGDRSELRLSQGEEAAWRRLCAEGAECSADNSPYVVEGTCFLQRARKQAEAAHLVVVNHALLLSDIAYGGRVLPPYEHLIIDEAHHLEGEATRQFGFSGGEREVSDLLERSEALRAAVRAALRGTVAALGPGGRLVGIAEAIAQAAAGARPRAAELSGQLAAFLKQQAAAEAGGSQSQLLLNRAMRVQPDWSKVEVAWENLRLTLRNLLSLLEELSEALGDSADIGLVNLELVRAEVGALAQETRELADGLAAAIEAEDPLRVVWLELDRRDGSPVVASAPLRVDETLRERLYEGRRSVILTGATLAVQGSFDYLRGRLGLDDAVELLLDSPFDYRRAALLLVPSDMPEPGWPDYTEAISRALVDLARAAGGRALALFTSHAALRTAYGLAKGPLQAEGIDVYAQGVDGSPRYLVQTLRSNSRAVVLGTASFWEGVDIAGEALSLLIIARLPFNVPTEPVFAARSAEYDDPFAEYAVPQAALRFKQGFGRLIRSRSDRGVVAVLDRRIVSKSYGAAFLDSLPPCRVREAPLRELAALTAEWLGQEAGSRK